MSNSHELVNVSSQNIKAVVEKFAAKNKVQENKTTRSFVNLLKKEMTELKQLDGIDWKLSTAFKYNTVFPVLQKGDNEKNIFLGSYSLDVMERYRIDQILALLQQASILKLDIAQIIAKVQEK